MPGYRYICKICNRDDIITDEKKFIFLHYTRHLRRDLNNTAIRLGITNKPDNENKYSLINSLITYSILHGV